MLFLRSGLTSAARACILISRTTACCGFNMFIGNSGGGTSSSPSGGGGGGGGSSGSSAGGGGTKSAAGGGGGKPYTSSGKLRWRTWPRTGGFRPDAWRADDGFHFAGRLRGDIGGAGGGDGRISLKRRGADTPGNAASGGGEGDDDTGGGGGGAFHSLSSSSGGGGGGGGDSERCIGDGTVASRMCALGDSGGGGGGMSSLDSALRRLVRGVIGSLSSTLMPGRVGGRSGGRGKNVSARRFFFSKKTKKIPKVAKRFEGSLNSSCLILGSHHSLLHRG
jgi:hypothetical protein